MNPGDGFPGSTAGVYCIVLAAKIIKITASICLLFCRPLKV